MRGMRPDDIALLAVGGDVRVSPDGRRVLYTLTTVDPDANAYRTRIWLADVDGDTRPRFLTAGEGTDHLPRWSPDGRMVAWATSRDGATAVQVLAVEGPGQATSVASCPDEVSELAWSPDGTRLAWVGRVPLEERYGAPGVAKKPGDMPPRRITRLLFRHDGDGWTVDRRPQVHVAPVDGSAPARALTDIEAGATGVAWSPSGDRLAYIAATHDRWDLDGCNDVWVVDAADPGAGGEGAEPLRLTDATAHWSHPSWSPDGTRIAVLAVPRPTNGPRHGQLHVLDTTVGDSGGGSLERWAPALDRNLAPYGATRAPVWADPSEGAGGEILTGADDHGCLHVLALTPDGHRVVVGGERIVRAWDAVGGTVAFVASTVTEPSEVWVASTAGSAAGERRLTDHSATLQARVTLSRPERFVAVSSGGTEVECWAMAPVGAEAGVAYPTVLNVHGGPFAQYGYGFFDEFQLQAGAGLGVVYCNPRGSSGYSEAWGRAIRWPEATDDPGSGWGGVDYDDVMACVEEAVGRFDWIDGDRLGVQGGSYGGYMTSWIVGHTDRFKVAVSERAVNNLITLEHDSDIAGFMNEYAGWTHVERPDIYARQSPATYVEAMTTPMLLVHSEEDLRCPMSQAEELFVALRLLGRDPELVRFPGESHELSRSGSPKHRVMRAEIILEWLDRHLGRGR